MSIQEYITPAHAPFVAHGILAIFGAIVHASKAYRDGKSRTWTDHLLLMIMATFSGVMFGLVGFQWFGPASYPALVMTGVGSYIGTEGMTYIVDYVLSKFSAQQKTNDSK